MMNDEPAATTPHPHQPTSAQKEGKQGSKGPAGGHIYLPMSVQVISTLMIIISVVVKIHILMTVVHHDIMMYMMYNVVAVGLSSWFIPLVVFPVSLFITFWPPQLFLRSGGFKATKRR